MHVISHATIIFVDIRRFSEFCDHVNVFQILEEFLGSCYVHLATVFAGAHIKTLGDGAMIIQECDTPKSEPELQALLWSILERICEMEILFRPTCIDFGRQCAEEAALRLGWAVTRGFVALLSPTATGIGISDWVGVPINTAAKLCKEAQPAGVIIDHLSFPLLPVFPASPKYRTFLGADRPFQARVFEVQGSRKPIAVWASLSPHDEVLPMPRLPSKETS